MSVQNLKKLLDKVGKCANYEMLFCLEEEFNSIGMTLQPTKQNKMILCTIKDGVPSANRIFEDYIHLGSLEDRSHEIPKSLLTCVRDFAENMAAEASLVKKEARSWQNSQTKMYGGFVAAGAEFHAPELNQVLEDMDDEPIIKRMPKKKGYWNSAVMSITNISEALDKIPEEKLLSENNDNIKKLGELLED